MGGGGWSASNETDCQAVTYIVHPHHRRYSPCKFGSGRRHHSPPSCEHSAARQDSSSSPHWSPAGP